MCMFNTGCPGWTGGYEDGFMPCSEDLGCATAYHDSVQKAITEDYPLETKGRYDRFAISKEDSVWVCSDCGMVCDPDTHDEECHVLDHYQVSLTNEDVLFHRVMTLLKIDPIGEFA